MKRWSDEILHETPKKVALVERTREPCGHALVSPLAVAKQSPNDLVCLALSIQQANTSVYNNACNKLEMIAQQIRFLQQQANIVLQETKTNQELHQVACNFVKVPGNVYHLYKRPSGQLYFSIIASEEWEECPNEFQGSFRLEQDQSWTAIKDIGNKDHHTALFNKIIFATQDSSLSCNSMCVDD